MKTMIGTMLAAAALSVSAAETGRDASWFREAQYGLFVHWGCYAVPARGEWYLNHSGMDPAEYAKFADSFKAERFDPADWARKAKRWGMKYVVFTTRHHDGYAMWDSAVNAFNCKRRGPGRDLLGELVPALKAEGLKVGFYYSPANWSDPDYAGYRVRGWPSRDSWKSEEARQRFVRSYTAELDELIAKYGAPDYIWWDGCLPGGLDGEKTVAEIRRRCPRTLTTERFGKPFDVRCCECEVRRPDDRGALWESCMTLNRNWGYHSDDHDWKNKDEVLDLLLDCRAGRGNLLLNVGPKADGTIPEESVKVLDQVGDFLAREGVRDALAVYADAICDAGDGKQLKPLFARAGRGETIRIAVMGGSITEGAHSKGLDHAWGAVFANCWREMFPKAKIEYLNAGVGATGSDVAAFRYSRDIAPFKPDLVALEFSVNDAAHETSRQSMEGLVRHARRDGAAVMLLGMTCENGTSAQEFHLKAIRPYGVPFVSYRDAVMPRVRSGAWKWDYVGADGIHPNRRGHAIAGELMGLFIRQEWGKYRRELSGRVTLPAPAITYPFEQGTFTLFSEVKTLTNDGFVPYEESRWGKGLAADHAGAKVSFEFEGRSAAILYRRGNLPLGKAKVTVDGKELEEHPCGKAGNDWWHTPVFWLCRDKPGKHHVTIETLPAEAGGEAGFRLAVLMVQR